MQFDLPGVTCLDTFLGDVVASCQRAPHTLVVLPPGRLPELVAQQVGLEAHRLDGHEVSMGRYAPSDASPEECGACLAGTVLGWEAREANDLDGTVLAQSAGLCRPRLAVALVEPEVSADATARGAAVADRIYELTKNTAGPVRFLFLLAHAHSRPAGVSAAVWPALDIWPHSIRFDTDARSRMSRAWDTYMSLRVYWEGSGQPAWMLALDSEARAIEPSANGHGADNALDRAFGRVLVPGPREVSACGEAFEASFAGNAADCLLRTGLVVHARVPVDQLVAEGLAWCPPNSSQAWLTCRAARALAHYPPVRTHLERIHSTPESMLTAARTNPLVALWTLGLAFIVERQLLALCHRNDTALQRFLEMVDARELSVRSRQSRGLMRPTSPHPLDHATYAELQNIVLAEDFVPRVPLTANALNQVRRVRNHCAHLRPISWRAVHATVEAISALADLG